MTHMPIKYPHPSGDRWALCNWADIPSSVTKGTVYLRRLRIVQTPWFGVYVHWINEADNDRYPHDHPWVFWSFVLRGAYTEQLYAWDAGCVTDGSPIKRERYSLHRMPLTAGHKITDVTGGLVTLVVVGRRVRKWCFWTPSNKIQWNKIVNKGVST